MSNGTAPDPPKDLTPEASDPEEHQMHGFLREVRSHSQSDQATFAALHRELRRIARAKMCGERRDHTLQPTELVHEAFLKVFHGSLPPGFSSDSSLAVRYIARAMGQILKDHASAYNAQKRGGPDKRRTPLDPQQAAEFNDENPRLQIDSQLLVNPEFSEQIMAVRDAIEVLRRTSPRQASIVESVFYGGLTQEEVAAALNVSVETVKLDLRKAKSFLKVEMGLEK